MSGILCLAAHAGVPAEDVEERIRGGAGGHKEDGPGLTVGRGAEARLRYNAARRMLEGLVMPLLDHFNPPLSRTHPWRGFHGAWAAAMARLLNHGVLPAGYYAVPLVDVEGPAEIDVATLQYRATPDAEEGAPAPQAWTPPAHGLAVAVELPAVEAVEVQVFADNGDPRLRAASELLSPRNKDRPQARRTFAVKYVSYLHQGSSVVVVDTVTTRRASLHAAILALLDREAEAASLPAGLSAVSYQPVEPAQDAQELRVWSVALGLGEPLPSLPLWLGVDLAVRLDLESSYRAACDDLLIRDAG
jgi:hypothetical protein